MPSPKQKDPIIVLLGEGIEIIFRYIPAGRFRMGQRGGKANEEPVTWVEVPEFWMGKTLVTQEQHRAITEAYMAELCTIEGNQGSEPSFFKNLEDSGQRPVENLNWHEARLAASWLMEKMRTSGTLPLGYLVDLPPEALWEYACRAGTETEYWNGDGEAALVKAGWNLGTYRVNTTGRPNHWGLHDMHGNVWEWCCDGYDSVAYRRLLDHSGGVWSEETLEKENDYRFRVVRGGSWPLKASIWRSAFRKPCKPDQRRADVGFRLCVFPAPVNRGPLSAEAIDEVFYKS